MYNDLKLALGILRHPFSLLVLGISFAATLLLYAGLARLAGWLIADSQLLGPDWLTTLASYTGGFFVLVIGWFLFPMTMTAISCLFLEELALRLERSQYPGLPAPRATDWGDALILTLRTLWRTLALNLLALPFYFIPGLNLLVYGLVNARLLSHDYYFALALRHLRLPEAEALYATQRGKLFKTGLQLAFLFLIPGLNIAAPILATGLMLHRLERQPDGPLRRAIGQAR